MEKSIAAFFVLTGFWKENLLALMEIHKHPKEVFAHANDGTPLIWKCAWPDNEERYPGVVLVPGGQYKNPLNVPDYILYEIASAGYFAASTHYRLAPPNKLDGQVSDGHYPDQCKDVSIAIKKARVHEHCSGRVGDVGGSAGGSHVITTGSKGTLGRDRSDCVVSLSGPTDFNDTSGPKWVHEDFVNYVGSDDPEKLAAASPLTHLVDNSAPTFVIYADGDTIPIAHFDKIVAKGSNFPDFQSYLIADCDNHSFEFWPLVSDRVLEFLERWLK